jgi:cation/acetate symporter
MAWIDKNGDGKIQYFGPGKSESGKDGAVFAGKAPIFAEGLGASGERLLTNDPVSASPNELWFGKDIMVMANPRMAGLPKWVIALLMAGCIAAALSTAAGLLLVLSTSISHDLMKKVVKPDLTDKEEIKWARLASLGALLVAVWFGINPPGTFVAKTVAFAFGLAASSFFPALLLGIFSKGMNKEGAIAGMVTGILFTLGYIIYFTYLGGTKSQYLWGISPEGIGFIGMILNFIVSIVVSRLTPAPPQEIRDLVDRVRHP